MPRLAAAVEHGVTWSFHGDSDTFHIPHPPSPAPLSELQRVLDRTMQTQPPTATVPHSPPPTLPQESGHTKGPGALFSAHLPLPTNCRFSIGEQLLPLTPALAPPPAGSDGTSPVQYHGNV